MSVLTTADFVDQLFDDLAAQGVSFSDLAAFKSAAVDKFTGWLGGDQALPAELGRRLATQLSQYSADLLARYDFWTLTAAGGPHGDGTFDLELPDGTPATFPSLAKLVQSLQKGDAAGVPFTFSTATADADPGAGKFRLNNAAPGSASFAYFSATAFGGADVTAFLAMLDDSTMTPRGYLALVEAATNQFALFAVTGNVVAATGYRKVPVALVAASGAFSSNGRVVAAFSRTGDKGLNAWTPLLTSEADGSTRRVLRVLDWFGGEGTKPATGYVASSGLVGTAAAADDIFAAINAALTSLKTAAETAASTAQTAATQVLDDTIWKNLVDFLFTGISEDGLRIGDAAGNYVFELSKTGVKFTLAPQSVTADNLDTLLLEDVLALRTLRAIVRYIPGTGIEIGDPSGNYTFYLGQDGSLTLPPASVQAVSIKDGAVGDAALSSTLLEDVLALRTLRKLVRLTSSGGLRIGSATGDYVVDIQSDGKVKLTQPDGSIPRALLASDVPGYVREKVASSAGGVFYAKTIGGKQQVVKATGAGETTLSDGTANDDHPQLVGESVRFTSDRDGGVTRAMRMLMDGKSVVSSRGSDKVYIIVGHGQSLSNGTSASGFRSAISTPADLGSVLMFNRGVRLTNPPGASTAVVASDIDRLVPMAAAVEGGCGQTLVESLAYKLCEVSGLRCIGVNSGVAALTYVQLKKGTVPYANMIAAIQRAKDILTALGWACEVVFCWQHGEANYTVSRATYKANLNELAADLNADICPITGQSAVHLFAGQSPSLSQSQVPLALWEAGKENPLIHCVGPLYDIPLSDPQHPTSPGYFYLGEQYWRAIKSVVVDGVAWKPLQPISATLSGSDIDVLFEGQTGNVVVDTTGVSALSNYGLEYFDASGSPPAISAVTTITGGVRVTLASPPSGSGKVLRGAFTAPGATLSPQNSIPGARTNLADQDTLASTYDGKALPKRCVIFEIPVT